MFLGYVNRGVNVVVGVEIFLLLVNSIGLGRIFYGEDFWRVLFLFFRVGYFFLRIVFLEFFLIFDFCLEDIVED